jgi:hypothetical protein
VLRFLLVDFDLRECRLVGLLFGQGGNFMRERVFLVFVFNEFIQ